MGIDIRLPIGLMFAIFGVMMTLYGAVSNPVIYARSLGININVMWGLMLLAFGVVMLLLGWRGQRAHRIASAHGAPAGKSTRSH